MCRYLVSLGYCIGRKRVCRLMRLMGFMAIYQKPKTSVPNPEHKRYPYLLRDLTIDRSNQVWCSDITYIPMRRGFYTWSPSWTGTAAKCCPGASQTLWRRIFALWPWKKPWKNTAHQISSTRIRAASLPALPLQTSCGTMESASPWTAGAVGWTMCLSNASGARLNMKTCTCTRTRRGRRPALALADGSAFTIRLVRTAAWTGQLQSAATIRD